MKACRLAVYARFDTPFARWRAIRQQHRPVAAVMICFRFVAEIRHQHDLARRTLPQSFEMMLPQRAFPFEVDDYFRVLARSKRAPRIVHYKSAFIFMPASP